jgi:hypothetical protein
MSTDYGLLCTECDEQILIDGMSQEYAFDLLQNLPQLYIAWEATNKTTGIISIMMIDYSVKERTIEDVMKFVSKHIGHGLCVCNEYGDDFGHDSGVIIEKPKKAMKRLMDKYSASLANSSEEEYYMSYNEMVDMVFEHFLEWIPK